MGNSGSAHNINWDSSAGGAFTTGRSKSELNGYYQHSRQSHAQTQDNETQTQTLLRRQHNQHSQKVDRIKSLPLGPVSEQFKVLPKITAENERLKLRPTTNGMLLHAGGTISGRNKDEMRVPGLMQRSRTLIFDQRESREDFKASLEVAMPAFQRSQTLLHMSYKERDGTFKDASQKQTQRNVYTKESNNQLTSAQNLRHARSEPDFRNDLNKPTHARQTGALDSTNVPTSTTTTSIKQSKLNKYNKKRKAPAAPVNAPAAEQIGKQEPNIDKEEKSQITRRFRSNVNMKHSVQQTPSPSPQQQKVKSTYSTQPMLPKAPIYRREKSCDAILLRSKAETTESTENEKRYSCGSKTPLKVPASVKAPTPTPAAPIQSTLPKQISKIPQLKRTFYFGMQSNGNEKSNIQKEHPRSQKDQTSKPSMQTLERANETNEDQTVLAKPAIVIADDVKDEQINTLKYKLHRDFDVRKGRNVTEEDLDDEESQINDNGILVHIRPSLPRRQLEVPSFSPAAAWRMLLNAEEDRHKQIQRSSSNNLHCESPIQLRSNKLSTEVEELRQKCTTKVATKTLRRDQLNTLAWTPQQDLEDDDDDDAKIAEDNDTSSSDDFDGGDKDEEDGLLFFNGHSKKARNESSTLKENEKSSSLGIHLFSLSLPRDAHLDSHMQKNSLNSNNNEKTTSFSSLQKLKLTISGGGNKCTCRAYGESSTESEICEIHSNLAMYRSDNWVLHKTGTKDGASNAITNSGGKLIKEDITPTVEPISLSFLTAGKHVMYLPGMTTSNKDVESDGNGVIMRKETTPTRESPKTAPRQRQRKKETRESLQDETPILKQNQSQAQPVNNSTQRFSFQSTVRLLEKRRLAEKLSRDAEIREAQRKSELEAMKRVEEDFQRKRASEKANIRHQLRLYCSGSGIETSHDQYNSLPAFASRQQQNDTNNNKIAGRRTEPEGAAASPSPSQFLVDLDSYRVGHQISHLPLKRMSSDCGDSDLDIRNTDITHFNRTASMVEPYLQSFMK